MNDGGAWMKAGKRLSLPCSFCMHIEIALSEGARIVAGGR